MAIVNLNNLSGIPANFLKELKRHDRVFKENIFIETILEDIPLLSLVKEIDAFCCDRLIVGFHYTRAISDEIAMSGLSCRTGEEIRRAFISKYSTIFTESELQQIKSEWKAHFDIQSQKSRDNLIFFNFTTCALNNYGAEPLLSNFGGEQVYMPLQDLPGIGEKIKNIGIPLILKCILKHSNLKTFFKYPWGRIAVSSYHCNINPEAIQFDQDGYQTVAVNPNDIEIIDYSKVQNQKLELGDKGGAILNLNTL